MIDKDTKDEKKAKPELTGLAAAINSPMGEKVYHDVLEAPLKEISGAVTNIAAVARSITKLGRLVAEFPVRARDFVISAFNRVPPERRQEADPAILGPAIEGLRFIDEDHPLAKMFQELLCKAFDSETAPNLHPAYPSVIKGMSPEEALLLFRICKLLEEHFRACAKAGKLDAWRGIRLLDVLRLSGVDVSLADLTRPGDNDSSGVYKAVEDLYRCDRRPFVYQLERLQLLGLIKSDGEYIQPAPFDKLIDRDTFNHVTLTPFGEGFAEACLPKEGLFAVAPPENPQ